MPQAKAFVFAGINGAGKSTYCIMMNFCVINPLGFA